MTKELKLRLRTLKSTHKITAAMKIVAATAFNRLRHNAPSMFAFLQSLIALSTKSHTIDAKNRRRLLIVVGGDRGLCGGYNTAIRKRALQYLKEFPDAEVAYIGTKVVLKEHKGLFTQTVQHLRQWTVLIDQLQPIWGQYGAVDIVYTVFQTLYDQQITLMPVYDGEPVLDDNATILDETATDIFPLIYTAIVMEAIIHAQLCEFSSRMLSMDNATQNAEKMIEALHLKINKMRQAMITKELSETTSGSINN